MKNKIKQFDAHEFRITDPARQTTTTEQPKFFLPCGCGCCTRDGKHDGWAGYVRAINGPAKKGVSVWVREANEGNVERAQRMARKTIGLLPEAQDLARVFACKLLKEIGDRNMATVVRRNKTADYADCCASHDFCDANMVMDAAFRRLYGVSAASKKLLNDDACLALWQRAWNMAKTAGFWALEDDGTEELVRGRSRRFVKVGTVDANQ